MTYQKAIESGLLLADIRGHRINQNPVSGVVNILTADGEQKRFSAYGDTLQAALIWLDCWPAESLSERS